MITQSSDRISKAQADVWYKRFIEAYYTLNKSIGPFYTFEQCIYDCSKYADKDLNG